MGAEEAGSDRVHLGDVGGAVFVSVSQYLCHSALLIAGAPTLVPLISIKRYILSWQILTLKACLASS